MSVNVIRDGKVRVKLSPATADLVERYAELSPEGVVTKYQIINEEIVAALHTAIEKFKGEYYVTFREGETHIFDKNGKEGSFSIDVSLEHLSNIEYSLEAQFNNMQVMNTTARDNDMFYGDIYASGDVRLRGDKAGVKMDIVGVSGDNSKFFMPLTDKSDIKSADFVKFATKEIDTTSY